MQVFMNKKEKEELVIKLHQENKTIRQIAEIVHMSFKDIGTTIRRIDGLANDDDDIDLSNKSKTTQAMYLFKSGKKPIDVAIDLDISASEIEDILQEYWVLNQLDELVLIYYEIRHDLDLFLKLFHVMKKNKLINQKDIQTVLRYAAFDIPTLQNRCQQLSNDILELQFRKKKLGDEVAIQSSSITQLEKSLNWYKVEIKQKKEIISNLDQQLNHKSDALEKLMLADK